MGTGRSGVAARDLPRGLRRRRGPRQMSGTCAERARGESAVESPAGGTHISELRGQRLGPYELVELIGRGGMAVVYRALQPALRRHVAIKVLPAYFVHEEDFLARFQKEAEL